MRRSMPIFSISLVKPNDAPMTPIEPTIRGRIGDDLIRRAGDHVAAGSRDILDEREHRLLLLGREWRMRLKYEMRLHRRTTRRVDGERDGPRTRQAKARSSCLATFASVRPGRSGVEKSDHAGEPYHRNHGNVAAKPARQDRAEKVSGPFEQTCVSHWQQI